MGTDSEWELWAQRDPYYSVLTHPEYRSARMTAEARQAFFQSGFGHVGQVMGNCHRYVDAKFSPRSVLDFGCGVGRLLIPFSEIADTVVGMDVSPSMLAEARRNCDEQGAARVALLPSDDSLSAVEGPFDLVHSCIVLQHIPLERGRQIFKRLTQLVAPGGIGVLDVAFAWDRYEHNHGQIPPPPPPSPPPSAWRKAKSAVRMVVKPEQSNAMALQHGSQSDPEMEMNFYNLSELIFILQNEGVIRLHVELADHSGARGAMLYFQAPRQSAGV